MKTKRSQVDAKMLGVRLSSEELKLIEAAYALELRPGDRGGVSAWVRKVALREASKLVRLVPRQVDA